MALGDRRTGAEESAPQAGGGSGRRGAIVAGTFVVILAIGFAVLKRREESAPEKLRTGASSSGRAPSKVPAAGQASTSPSVISSVRRPPPTAQPTSTHVAGGEVTPEVPFDSAPDEDDVDICDRDLDAVFELCDPARSRSDCDGVAAEEADGCQAGCVMQTCRKLRDCAEPDPAWCGSSCADARGGLFWLNFWSAYYACKWQVGEEQPARGDCTVADLEARCPELAGTEWTARFRGLYK